MVSVGIIGLGRIGQLAHLEPLLKIPGCKVAALADLRPKLANLVSTHYGIPRVYHSHTDLLSDRSIDAVVVVTHRHLTAAVVSDCLDAGKHVLAEKPLAYNTATARQLVEKAVAKGVLLAIGYMKRFDTMLNAVKALIERQHASHGGLTADNSAFRFYNYGGDVNRQDSFLMTDEIRPIGSQPDFPAWLAPHLYRDYDEFLNVFSHDINLITYLLGPGVTAQCTSAGAGIRQYIMTSKTGMPATFETGRLQSSDWHEGFHAILPDCDISFRFAAPLSRESRSDTTILWHGAPDPHFSTSTATAWPFETQAREFIQSIADGKKMRTSADASINDFEIIETFFKTMN